MRALSHGHGHGRDAAGVSGVCLFVKRRMPDQKHGPLAELYNDFEEVGGWVGRRAAGWLVDRSAGRSGVCQVGRLVRLLAF